MSVVSITSGDIDKRARDAQALRDMADMVERGDIVDFVFVANDLKGKCYRRFTSFEDRWRILAALEYARSGVHDCD